MSALWTVSNAEIRRRAALIRADLNPLPTVQYRVLCGDSRWAYVGEASAQRWLDRGRTVQGNDGGLWVTL